MSFLYRVFAFFHRESEKLSHLGEIREEPLLLHVKRSWLWWLGHLFRMPPGHLSSEVFQVCPSCRWPQGRLRTLWKDCLSAGLEVPRNTLQSAGGSVWGE